MGKTIKNLMGSTTHSASLFLVIVILASCVPSTSKSVRGRTSANATTGTSGVGVSQGRVLKDNPIILSGSANLSTSYDLNKLLGTAVTITSDTFLEAYTNCAGLTYCFEVKATKDSTSPLQTTDGRWGYSVRTPEFLQVNTFYHMNKLFNLFFSNLGLTYGLAYDSFGSPLFDTAIPNNNALYNADGTFNLNTDILKVFANCDALDNAYYEQSTESLCFGYSGANKELFWAHDSTIIYHEAGHFFQALQLNLRNNNPSDPSLVKSQMGTSLYSEAGAIGEGLSDFFSYYTNGRTHWGEWAAGKLQASRPLSENDSLHAPGLAIDEDQRLSYPQYINYDPNFSETPVEDVHNAGMVISHYLVALSQDLQAKCLMPAKDSREFVMYLLNETMAELGDLNAQGTVNGAVGKVNMSRALSSLWFNTVNPINYRSFAQTMAKNLRHSVGNPLLTYCNGSYYDQAHIETLLDSYGLLLFKTYNEHRNETNASTKINTIVSAANRKRSVLISKNNIILDPTPGASSAFVIDNRAQILDGYTNLHTKGVITDSLSAQTPEDLGFNNGNSKVSRGEVVAIALNLYNNSNSTMGGIQILANDWDHADTSGTTTKGRACQFGSELSNDQWPLETEGGVVAISSGLSKNNCGTVATTAADFAPVCFIQSSEANSTKWVSQHEFRNKLALEQNYCLNKTDDKDCFIRALKGADKAYYSKINPKSTWGQTMADPETGTAYNLELGNVVMFEVSKHIPPGTVFDCRLRVRFTNCEDCYHDSTRSNNDYLDSEYNGPRPFKVIHLQIPVTD